MRMGFTLGSGTHLVIWPAALLLGACAAACWWFGTHRRGAAIVRAVGSQFAPPPHKPYMHVARSRGGPHNDHFPTVATGLVTEAS